MTVKETGWGISRILVGVDFGMSSAAALSYAHALADHLGARLVAVYADEDGRRNGDASTPAGTLDIFARQVAPGGVDCERVITSGRPAPVLLEAARDLKVDLIVLGSHGRGRMGRLALGSVSAEILRHTPIPVLIVRATAEPYVNGLIIVGVDFSPASEAALATAGALAGPAHATVEALHVLPYGEHHSAGHEILRRDALMRLDALRERLVPSPVASRSAALMVDMGDPAAAITAHAVTTGARLIVVGRHGASGAVAGRLGSIAGRLLHQVAIPVLTVRG